MTPAMQTLKLQVNKTTFDDVQLHQPLRWLQYLEGLNAGAWGDHIAVQGLADADADADVFHVDNHIISTISPDMELIRTSHNASAGVIHLGLIGQFHYQALQRIDEYHPAQPGIRK